MKKTIVAAAVVFLALGTAGTLQAAGQPEPPSGENQEAQEMSATSAAVSFAQGEEVSVRRLLGRSVQGLHGDRLGEVSGVLLDIPRNQVAYLVISPSEGGKQRIIPWQAVSIHPQTASLTADIDASRFREAPEGTEVATQQQAQEIHQFYGVAPYWQKKQQQPSPAMEPPAPEPQVTSPPEPTEPEEKETPLWFE